MNQRRRAQEIIIQLHSSLSFPSASSIFHWPHREHGAAASPGNQRVKDALRQSVQVSLPGHTAGWRRVEVDLERQAEDTQHGKRNRSAEGSFLESF